VLAMHKNTISPLSAVAVTGIANGARSPW